MDLNTSLKVKTMKKGQVRKVYRGWLRWDFPPAERRPLRRVLKFVSQGKYECLRLWRGEEQVGYASWLWMAGVVRCWITMPWLPPVGEKAMAAPFFR